MPIKYDIIQGKSIVLAVGSGIVTAKDILAHLENLAKDKNYIKPMKKIVDYRSIDRIEIKPDEAQLIAFKKKELSNIFSGEKCAFISPGDLTYGTSRVHQSLIERTDIDTQVFRSFEEAMEWLNISLEND